jgi:hypothetical protein
LSGTSVTTRAPTPIPAGVKALTRTGRINGRDFGECGCASRCRRSDDCRPSRPVGRTGPTTLATVEIVRYRAGPALGTAPDSDGSSDARRTSAARRHLLLLIRRGRSEWSGCPRGKSVSAARGEPAPCAAGRNRSAGNRAAHRAIRDGPHHRATFIIANSNQKSLIRSMVAAQGEAVGQSDCSTIFCG